MSGISIELKYRSGPGNQARSTFIVRLIISSVVGFSVLYNIESWSLQKQSLIHFVCMLVTIFPCLILSGWFKKICIRHIKAIRNLFNLGNRILDNLLFHFWSSLVREIVVFNFRSLSSKDIYKTSV